MRPGEAQISACHLSDRRHVGRAGVKEGETVQRHRAPEPGHPHLYNCTHDRPGPDEYPAVRGVM